MDGDGESLELTAGRSKFRTKCSQFFLETPEELGMILDIEIWIESFRPLSSPSLVLFDVRLLLAWDVQAHVKSQFTFMKIL